MTNPLSKNWRDWPTPPMLEETIYAEDPVGILTGLKRASRKRQVGFDHKDLESAARAWERAAVAALGDPYLVTEFTEQAKKFRNWHKELMNGMHERKESGIMILDRWDWPKPELFGIAQACLIRAEVRTIN